MDRKHFVIGSRKSDLAMWQSRHVHALLSAAFPHFTFEIKTEIASGDVLLDKPLAQLATANPGLFTKELEVGLVAKAYDLAVHSLKDMPTKLPDGLVLAGISEREDPRDAFILSAKHGGGTSSPAYRSVEELPLGATVGTSSLRREAILKSTRPDLKIVTIRGNLNTRFRKLDAVEPVAAAAGAPVEGAVSAAAGGVDAGATGTSAEPVQYYDALVLAAAGVKRMGWANRITAFLSAQDFPYGVGQGALGLECRADDAQVIAFCRAISNPRAAAACLAERVFLNRLQGGCQVPIGAHTCFSDEGLLYWQQREEEKQRSKEAELATAVAPSASSLSSSLRGAAGAGGAGAAAVSVFTLSLTGSVLSTDGTQQVTATKSLPVQLPVGAPDITTPASAEAAAAAAQEAGSAGAGGAGGVGSGDSWWGVLSSAAEELGSQVAKALLAAGAASILGPLGEHRPLTYGAAEERRD